MAEKKESEKTAGTSEEAPERDKNAEGALEGTGDGTSADATGAAIEDEVDAEDEDDDDE